MKNTKYLLSQKNSSFLASLGFYKPKNIVVKKEEKDNVFITAVHFDKNVINKENSQFLPKIKNIVNEYQTEKIKKENKINFWFNINYKNNNINELKKVNINQFNEGLVGFSQPVVNNPSSPSGQATFFFNKKVEVSWLLQNPINIIKKGNLLNSKIIEQLSSTTSKKTEISQSFGLPFVFSLNTSPNRGPIAPPLGSYFYSYLNKNKKEGESQIKTIAEGKEAKRNKNTTIYQYLYTISKNTPTGNGINLTPKLNKKYGILLKYNKIISYSFLKNKPAFQFPVVNNNPFIYNSTPIKNDLNSRNYDFDPGLGLSYFYSENNQNKNNKHSYGGKSCYNNINGGVGQGGKIVEELYKLLLFYFKSIYCLISKPVISITPDKVKIQLFYYLTIPKKSIIRLFAIHYLNSYKNKWIKMVATGSSRKGGYKPNFYSHFPSLFNENQRQKFENNKNKLRFNLKNNLKKINNDNNLLLGYDLNGQNLKAKDRNNYFFNINKKVRLPYIKNKARKSISRFKSKPNKIRSILFNLVKFNITRVFTRKFKLICKILSNKFNKPVELELTRLHNPYLDSNILANLLQLIIKNKKRKPKKAVDKIYNKNQIKKLNDPNLDLFRGRTRKNKPAFLSGLNFYINGRLMGEPIVPRLTTKTFEKGATATGKVNFLDNSSITKKNKKGAYTIKVISAQNFF